MKPKGMRKKILLIPLALLLAVSLVATGCPTPVDEEEPVVELPVRYGAWVDEVVAIEVVDFAAGITMLEGGELDIYIHGMAIPELFQKVVASPDLEYEVSYGVYDELTCNPVGPTFPGTGKLNPFSVPRIREAMNWLIDRTHIAEEIYGGLAIPRYTAVTPVFPDYARFAEVAGRIELEYAHDPEEAERIITEEMEKLGAELINGKWLYGGEPVELKFVIRIEDKRLEIGDYLSDLLEDIGFVVERMYKTSAEASPLWLRGNPADGEWHIYTGAWVTTVVSRDEGDNFDFFYTDRGLPFPLYMAYEPAPAFYEVAGRLGRGDYVSIEERAELFKQALELSMEDSARVWLAHRVSFVPRRAEIAVAADLAGGISGAYLWALTSRFEEEGVPVVGGTLKVAVPSMLPEPWNPIAGSNWIYDMTYIRATADWGKMWDPFTGLHWPQRIERAEVFVKEGLPVGVTHDWVDLQFVPEIEVPDDAWVDWDATEQRFITAAEEHPEGLTAKTKSVAYYPDDLYEKVKWHDGSTFSLADIVLSMILTFDRAKEESPIFDAAEVPSFDTFMEHFRGLRIVSEDPLVIEFYSDRVYLDAEWIVETWFPYYAQGPGAWHNLTLGILAESDRELAFSAAKAEETDVEWMSYIAGPSLPIFETHLARALAEGIIPYQPTLGQFITAAEATERWTNLQAWYEAKGHLWIGTGPFYLEKAYSVEKIVHLKRFVDFPDLVEKWVVFAEPRVAQVEVSGPTIVTVGTEAEFLLDVTFKGEPYPVADVDFVSYLVVDAEGVIDVVGYAEAVQDGLWKVVLTAEATEMLATGSARLQVAFAPVVVAIPTFTSLGFVVLP